MTAVHAHLRRPPGGRCSPSTATSPLCTHPSWPPDGQRLPSTATPLPLNCGTAACRTAHARPIPLGLPACGHTQNCRNSFQMVLGFLLSYSFLSKQRHDFFLVNLHIPLSPNMWEAIYITNIRLPDIDALSYTYSSPAFSCTCFPNASHPHIHLPQHCPHVCMLLSWFLCPLLEVQKIVARREYIK